MKGHSKIELTDVNTGAVQTFENDNMVTNALKYFLQDYCVSHNCLIDSNIKSKNAWKTLLGGIMLFDSTLEEDVENVLPRAGMKMVGNGCYGVSNSGNVAEMGSFNTSESGVQADGSIKMVYDFSTAQANGTIKSCALSSAPGGCIGIGNASGYRFTSAPSGCDGIQLFSTYVGSYLNMYLPDGTSFDGNVLIYVDDTNNYLMWQDRDGYSPKKNGTIVFKKYGINLSKINLKYSNTLSNNLIETYTVTVPDDLKTYLNSASSFYQSDPIICGKNYYRAYATSSSVGVNGEFYILKIDENMNATITKMYNTTGYPILVNYAYAVIDNEWLLLPTTSATYKHYAIKISDSTIVKYLGTWTPSSYASCTRFNDALLTTDLEVTRYVDIKNNTAYWTSDKTNASRRYLQCIGNPLLFCETINGRSSGEQMKFLKYCGYLATINNLSTPVTKTASQTMKVTYTLTFD